MKRTAVITDTISSRFYFPLWHRYYASQVGAENIFVITYGDRCNDFEHFNLGHVWKHEKFDNNLRVDRIQEIIASLLPQYDFVIRVDTDEFLVPDPRSFPSLSDYLQRLDRPYVTAMGYNVIQDFEEGPLDLDKPILISQRGAANPYDALCKTCIISIPVKWAPGFHFCSVFPAFNDLYLLHLKLADLDLQVEIGQEVAAITDEKLFKEYHLTPRAVLAERTAHLLKMPRYHGFENFQRKAYNDNFINQIKFTQNLGGIYHGGAMQPEPIVVCFPQEFKGYL